MHVASAALEWKPMTHGSWMLTSLQELRLEDTKHLSLHKQARSEKQLQLSDPSSMDIERTRVGRHQRDGSIS